MSLQHQIGWDLNFYDEEEGRVLAAARRVFAMHGYEAALLRDVAAGAGVTQDRIRYWYGGKEGLFHEVLRGASHQLANALVVSQGRKKRPFAEHVREFLDAHQRFCQKDPEMAAILVRGALCPGLVTTAASAIRYAAVEARALDIFEKGLVAGEIELRIGLDARRAANVLIAAAEILMIRAVQSSSSPAGVMLTSAEAAELLLSHLRARP